jgi:hypothetical protein
MARDVEAAKDQVVAGIDQATVRELAKWGMSTKERSLFRDAAAPPSPGSSTIIACS